MWRRSSVPSSLRTSGPSRRISPLDGSTNRLIMRIVVVLPQPDGPTNITISPAGMSIVTLSTAGSGCPGECLVSSRSWMLCPAPLRIDSVRSDALVLVMVSATEASRCGQSADELEAEVENECEKHDTDGAGDGRVHGVDAADPGEPGEDRLPETRALHVGGDGRDAHDQLRRDADAGEHHGP